MGTPFISFLEPTKLDGYDCNKPHDQQSPHIPRVFCDAMEVREAVFVKEQKFPAELEYDSDDARSCHWVVYASVNRVTEPEQRDPSTGTIVQLRKSETRSQPIGTMRIVPFPHPPHPKQDGWYVGDVLQSRADPDAQAESLSVVEEARQNAALPYGEDRATTFHDGMEPYVKLGRLAVIPEFRGHKISAQLWGAARTWLKENPSYFDPSVTELGMDALKVDAASRIPKWRGLVCCHAQERVVKTYEKWGFQVDEGMGRWFDGGITHVGLFIRLDVKDVPSKV
ncbi:uncharacterized protein BCR38DRAFT_212493 [Pseudomassariella vexata]|uniref:N-acetyltransferase domain-containing protein n=1 Tax=Pseudomassariella vexata TaxID=1141098 RepID=A0A1Y2DYR0_9PEZI|nr:uncharacterized protein BCR38DRAFT_212493 [Pseudomassariella vexata]ORY64349.1 hypothetical protein BCR38DRAFT_212493 [Pseudomassariella vexata]